MQVSRRIVARSKNDDREKKMDEKIVIELDRVELHLATQGVSAVMQMLTEYIEKHRNHKDYSMDKLFSLMDMYATAGNLWANLQKAQGTTQEEIAQYLAEQDK